MRFHQKTNEKISSVFSSASKYRSLFRSAAENFKDIFIIIPMKPAF